jgi:hypothetical protein
MFFSPAVPLPLFSHLTQVTMDASPSAEGFITRTLITTSTGALQLWKQGDLQWTREEGLAATTVAEFVELPEKVQTSARGDGEESFLSRVVRQIGDAQVCLHAIYLRDFTKLTFSSELPPIPCRFCQTFRDWLLCLPLIPCGCVVV